MISSSCEEQLTNPNPALYDEDLWDVAKGYCSYFRTAEAAIVTRLGCSASVISSILIIYIINISPTKLSSIYHRIMFGMSIATLATEGASALTTLPMPSPGDYWTDINNFQGTRMGNIQTCTAQGFFIAFGMFSLCGYNLGLCLYYLCAIGFRMTTDNMKKYVEPLIHTNGFLVPLAMFLPGTLNGDYNTSFDLPTCQLVPRPWFCDSDEVNLNNVPCDRWGKHQIKVDTTSYLSFPTNLFTTSISVCFFLLSLVCCRVYHAERQMKLYMKSNKNKNNQSNNTDIPGTQSINDHREQEEKQDEEDGSTGPQTKQQQHPSRDSTATSRRIWWNGKNISKTEMKRIQHQFNDTKVIALQAIFYLLILCLSLGSWIVLSRSQQTHPSSIIFNSTLLFVTSAEGFYTLVIFMFHKVYNIKRSYSHAHLSVWEAIIQIFKNGGTDDSFVMSRMHLISHHNHNYEYVDNDNDKSDDDESYCPDHRTDHEHDHNDTISEDDKDLHSDISSLTGTPFESHLLLRRPGMEISTTPSFSSRRRGDGVITDLYGSTIGNSDNNGRGNNNINNQNNNANDVASTSMVSINSGVSCNVGSSVMSNSFSGGSLSYWDVEDNTSTYT